MEEKQMCKKCGEREVVSENCPYCAYCWNHLDSGNPRERSILAYYGNKMFYAEHPEVAVAIKEKKKQYQKEYINKNREKWNAYQRDYAKRKRAEAKINALELKMLKKEKERLKELADNLLRIKVEG
jgi:hypothetical protein